MPECSECENYQTEYCMICQDKEFFMDEETKKWNDLMCDMMCGE